MKRTILIYSLSIAGLLLILKLIDYKYVIRDISMEIYLGLTAILFTALGIWAGLKILNPKKKEALVIPDAEITDKNAIEASGLSKREYEVLELMALGYSNLEIAEKLFVSVNTIKTHVSRILYKMEVKRRTQAIQKAKELRIII